PRVARRVAGPPALATRRPLRLANIPPRSARIRRPPVSRHRRLGDRAVVRQGFSMIRRSTLAVAWLATLLLGPAAARGQSPPAKPEPIDRKPYAIRILLDFDARTRIDPTRRASILDEWLDLVQRFVGAPWAPE